MGIKWRLLYRLWSMRHFFKNTHHTYCSVPSQTSNIENAWSWDFHRGSTIFVTSNWRRYCKIDGDIAKLTEILQNIFNKSKLSQYLISSSMFKIQERYIETTLWKSRQMYSPVLALSLPCIEYQKPKTTFKSFNFLVY